MKTLITLALALLTGCVAPSAQKWAAADYGPEPTNTDALVQAWIKDALLDPYSVRDLLIQPPKHGAYQKPGIEGFGYVFGWRIDITLFAKNRMGGYGGKHRYLLLVRDGSVVASTGASLSSLPDRWY